MTTPTPTLSIIIPFYNTGHFLEETLNSILAQSYPFWEVWLIDDGSTDEGPEIAQQFAAKDPRFHYYRQPERQGKPSCGRNKGLALATGEFITFMDSDDVYKPDGLKTLLDPLLEESNLNAVLAFPYYTDAQLNPMHPSYELEELGPDQFQLRSTFAMTWESICRHQKELYVCSFMGRASVLKSFRFDEQLSVGEDYRYILSVFAAGTPEQFKVLPKATYWHRYLQGSITKTPSRMMGYLDDNLRLVNWLFSLPDLPKACLRHKPIYLGERLHILCKELYRMGMHREALQIFWFALRHPDMNLPTFFKVFGKTSILLCLPLKLKEALKPSKK
jgi:glycosyltransferase involved in cell wall biosynthesis